MDSLTTSQNTSCGSSVSKTIQDNGVANENVASEKSFFSYLVTSVLHVCKEIKRCASSLAKSIYSRKVCAQEAHQKAQEASLDENNITLLERDFEEAQSYAEHATKIVKANAKMISINEQRLDDLSTKKDTNTSMIFSEESTDKVEDVGTQEITQEQATRIETINWLKTKLVSAKENEQCANQNLKRIATACKELKKSKELELEKLYAHKPQALSDSKMMEKDGFIYDVSYLEKEISTNIKHIISLQKMIDYSEIGDEINYCNTTNIISLKEQLKNIINPAILVCSNLRAKIAHHDYLKKRIAELNEYIVQLRNKLAATEATDSTKYQTDSINDEIKQKRKDIVLFKKGLVESANHLKMWAKYARDAHNNITTKNSLNHCSMSIIFLEERIKRLHALYHSDDAFQKDSAAKEIMAEYDSNIASLQKIWCSIEEITKSLDFLTKKANSFNDIPDDAFPYNNTNDDQKQDDTDIQITKDRHHA